MSNVLSRLFKMLSYPSVIAILACVGCGRQSTLPDIGQKVAGPVDLEFSQQHKLFYALNSDFDRSYSSGSLLVINSAGEKLAAHPVPRMGRAFAQSGNDLVAVFDAADDGAPPQVVLYEIASDGYSLKEVKTWSRDSGFSCGERAGSPSNIVMRDNYGHFAVSCINGDLFIGTLKSPRSDSTIHRIRNYAWSRRAMYIDPKRELLFAFMSDNREREATDYVGADTKSYNTQKGVLEEGANDVPDPWEETETLRRNKRGTSLQYQFAIYDIAKGREAGFTFDDMDQSKPDKSADGELHWLYYTLLKKDGSPDIAAGVTDPNQKAYRTNFWSTYPDPEDEDAFYLSQRGKPKPESTFSNNVVKISIKQDSLTALQDNGKPYPTKDLFSFERVYGFAEEIDAANHFTGDIVVQKVGGKKFLFVNHFKDLVYFRKNPRFSLVVKDLDLSAGWLKEIKLTRAEDSIFQLAVSDEGKVLTGSFYGNKLIPFTVEPSVDLKLGWESTSEIK